MTNQTNNNALNSINPLAYVGVNPRTPPNFVINSFAPGTYDSKNFQIGTFWLNTGNSTPPNTPPTIDDLYVLVALYGGQATWLPFSSGDVQFLEGNTGGPVPPTSNIIHVVGDGTTVTVAGNPGSSTLTISLVGGGVAAQSFPTDSGTATPNGLGVLNINAGNSTKHCGSSVLFSGSGNTVELSVTDSNLNTFVGSTAGSLTISGTHNCGYGSNVLHSATTADSNSVFGSACAGSVTTGSQNCVLSSGGAGSLTTGSNNVILGVAGANLLVSGSNNLLAGGKTVAAAYTTSESNNVILGNNVGVVGESNTIRIGSDGVTTANQTQCFINGISGITPSGTVKTVVINASGQLGTSSAAGIPAIEFIQTQTATNSASLNFTTGLTFTKYMVIFRNIVPATNTAIFQMLESTDGGGTWLAAGYTSWIYELTISTGTTIGTAQPTTFFQLSGNVGSSAGQSVSGTIYLMLPNGTNSVGWGDGYFFNTFPMTPSWSIQKFGYVGNTTVNAIQFLFDSGNITSGVISLYGIVE